MILSGQPQWTLSRQTPDPGAPVFYYEGGLCTRMRRQSSPRYERFLVHCRALAAELRPYRVAERWVNARQFSWWRYDAPRVRLALYRVPSPAPFALRGLRRPSNRDLVHDMRSP